MISQSGCRCPVLGRGVQISVEKGSSLCSRPCCPPRAMLLHQLPCVLYGVRSALQLKPRSFISQHWTLVGLHQSDRKLGCLSLGFDYNTKVIKTGRGKIPGFKVYSRVLALKKRVSLRSTDWRGRFVKHLEGRSECRSWLVRSSCSPLLVLAAGKTNDDPHNGSRVASRHLDGLEGELMNSIHREESAERQARTFHDSVDHHQRRTSRAEAAASNKYGVKHRTQVVGKKWRQGEFSSSGRSGYVAKRSFSSKAEQRSSAASHPGETAVNPLKQEAGEREQKQQTKKSRKKEFTAESMLRLDLNMCSKDGDVLRALEIYDRSMADGVVQWNQYKFNILLYLCSSAALGTLTAGKSGTDRVEAERLNLQPAEQNLIRNETVECTNSEEVEQQDSGSNGAAKPQYVVLSPDIMELAAKRGFEIYKEMNRQEVPPNEATLTAVARLAVRTEDGDLAFQMVKAMAAMNLAPKLRSYSPALVIFCKKKEVEKAFEVDAHMLEAGVQPEETELGALLRLSVDLGLEKRVYSLLHRLRARVRELSPDIVAVIEEWFSGKEAASAVQENWQPSNSEIREAVAAGGGGWHGLGWLGEGEWKVKWTNIDRDGVCCSCKEKLVTIDLDPQETENFAQSLAKLAAKREMRPYDFQKFQDWLRRHGPFDAIVDGANVGLYNQNMSQGFNFFQLNAVVRTAQQQGLSKNPPLIILHNARTRFGAATSPVGQQLLHRWDSADILYTTPSGSNDDWYWLYAAVKNKCLLITNDEMRDHLFQLLGTDFFPKWKERHQVRYSATSRGPQFHLPPPYSLVIQESEGGSWHIPKEGGDDIHAPREWLCVTRPGLSSDKPASLSWSQKVAGSEQVESSTETSDETGIPPPKAASLEKMEAAAETSDGAGISSPKVMEKVCERSDEVGTSSPKVARSRKVKPAETSDEAGIPSPKVARSKKMKSAVETGTSSANVASSEKVNDAAETSDEAEISAAKVARSKKVKSGAEISDETGIASPKVRRSKKVKSSAETSDEAGPPSPKFSHSKKAKTPDEISHETGIIMDKDETISSDSLGSSVAHGLKSAAATSDEARITDKDEIISSEPRGSSATHATLVKSAAETSEKEGIITDKDETIISDTLGSIVARGALLNIAAESSNQTGTSSLKVARSKKVKGVAETSDEVGTITDNDAILSSDWLESSLTDGGARGDSKRSRKFSPSPTLCNLRAADKRSDSGPVMFDI